MLCRSDAEDKNHHTVHVTGSCRHYREPDEMANGADPQRLLTCQGAYRRVNGW